MTNEQLMGVLPINKEKGMTSHDVVNRVRRIFGIKRVGHTGTLDPNAEGVLLVCIGKAVKFIQFFSNTNKKYRAEILFGIQTDTDDITGKILKKDHSQVSEQVLKSVLPQFRGQINQKPPIYSALKKNGVRYYDYARHGVSIDIPLRQTRIDALTIQKLDLPKRAVLDVACASGTYIRSLCRDIGLALGTVACMGDLIRTMASDIKIGQCLKLDDLDHMTKDQRVACLLPVEQFLNTYPVVQSTVRGDHFIKNGAALYPWNANSAFDDLLADEIVLITDSYHEFIGIGKMNKNSDDDPHVSPVKMI